MVYVKMEFLIKVRMYIESTRKLPHEGKILPMQKVHNDQPLLIKRMYNLFYLQGLLTNKNLKAEFITVNLYSYASETHLIGLVF